MPLSELAAPLNALAEDVGGFNGRQPSSPLVAVEACGRNIRQTKPAAKRSWLQVLKRALKLPSLPEGQAVQPRECGRVFQPHGLTAVATVASLRVEGDRALFRGSIHQWAPESERVER
jgi:hypothetical protein